MTFLLLSPTRAGDEPRSGRRLPRRSGTWPVWTVVVGVVVVLGVGVVSPSAHLMALDEEETSDSHETLQFLERKRSDGSGSYFYTSISSPNFPAPFTTPFSEFYVINTSTLAGQVGANHVVNIYLCELFTAEESFKIYDGAGMERVLSREVKQIPIQLRDDEVAEIQVQVLIIEDKLKDINNNRVLLTRFLSSTSTTSFAPSSTFTPSTATTFPSRYSTKGWPA